MPNSPFYGGTPYNPSYNPYGGPKAQHIPQPIQQTQGEIDAAGRKRYGNAVYDNPDFYQQSLFGYGEDSNNAISMFSSIFGDPKNWAKLLNKQFDTAGQSLGQREASSRSQGQRAAGALYGQGNYLNPSQGILNAGNQAARPYADAFGQLESQRAGALSDQDQRMRSLLLQLIHGSYTGQQNRDWQEEQNKPGAFDYIGLGAKVGAAAFGGMG